MSKVNFKRIRNIDDLTNIDIYDGNLIVSGDGKLFVDYENSRVAVGGTPDTEMSDTSNNSIENKVVKTYIDNSLIALKECIPQKWKYVVEEDTDSIDFNVVLEEGESLKIKTIQKGTYDANRILYLLPNNLTGSGYSIRTISSGTATAQQGITTESDYVAVNGYDIAEMSITGYSYNECQLNLVNGRLISNKISTRFNSGEQRQVIASSLIPINIDSINSIKIRCSDNTNIKKGTIFIFEKI